MCHFWFLTGHLLNVQSSSPVSTRNTLNPCQLHCKRQSHATVCPNTPVVHSFTRYFFMELDWVFGDETKNKQNQKAPPFLCNMWVYLQVMLNCRSCNVQGAKKRVRLNHVKALKATCVMLTFSPIRWIYNEYIVNTGLTLSRCPETWLNA